jgi:hypothetical protein
MTDIRQATDEEVSAEKICGFCRYCYTECDDMYTVCAKHNESTDEYYICDDFESD